jgi:peptidoglycan-associated lipoprotein
MRYALPLIAALLLAACSSQPPAPEQNPAGVEDRTPQATSKGVNDGNFEPFSIAGLKDPRSPLFKRSIYFDFDQYVIKDEFKSTIEAHAKFLVANPQLKVLIQGNADERGSREYNLALGQKRAEAVKKALALLGAREDQIESVSLGKEKPVCSESSEECWARNRRADILHSATHEF